MKMTDENRAERPNDEMSDGERKNDQPRKMVVCILANKVRQLENELRYCLDVIDDNLDVKHDLRIEYAKTLVLPTASDQAPAL